MQKKVLNEQGFVLVTALVLLAILTLIGIASSYKTMTEIKVSRIATDMDKAKDAAESGLTQLYWQWALDGVAGKAEFDNLNDYVLGKINTAPNVYQGDLTPSSAAEVTDAIIQSRAGKIKVFTLMNNQVIDTYAWGSANAAHAPQVAVWVTTFDDNTTAGYPYEKPVDLSTGASCVGTCRLVTYAYGRFGSARQLMRETQSVVSKQLRGVSALSNAPYGEDFNAICSGSGITSGTANAGAWAAGNSSTVIEATQAPYTLGVAPSGTALASNTKLGSGSKGFRKGTSSKTGATFATAPYILYSGHDTSSGFKADWASTTIDTTGATMPASKIPNKLVNAPLLGKETIDYFSEPNKQLFSMDTYRWAAEQFTCQDPTKPDGQFGNGIYCSKAERLRQALVKLGFPAYAPVTGRLTIAQIQYNIANGIPMFGMVRLMFPAVPTGTSTTCNGKPVELHVIESAGNQSNMPGYTAPGYDFNKLMACPKKNGTNKKDCAYKGAIPDPDTNGDGIADGPYAFTIADGAKPDNDGDLGANARLIVYGTILIDYFADYDIYSSPTGGSPGAGTDTVFNPANGERLLSPLESPDVYLAIEHTIMVNPVMPRFEGNTPLAFPTAATTIKPNSTSAPSPSRLNNPAPNAAANNDLATVGRVNMTSLGSAKPVNLASPYDGYFPWDEGLLPAPIGNSAAGTMRFMSRNAVPDHVDNSNGWGLLSLITDPAVGFGVGTEVTAVTQRMRDLLTMSAPSAGKTEADVLHYYYKLMVETLDKNEPNDWPIAPWPGNNLSANFCIGEEDCGTSISNPTSAQVTNHMGDKLHLMFPTGYMHGWKVALAALDITADEWNHILSGGAKYKGIGETGGLYTKLNTNCSAGGSGMAGAGCPFYFGVDDGAKDQATVQSIQDDEDKYFHITTDPVTGYGLLDSKWKDIPSTMYSGGLLDMHAHSNMNGIMYTPGPLEWEPGNSDYDPNPIKCNTNSNANDHFAHMSYINGSIITGYGAFIKNQCESDRYVLVFDMQAVDNINVNQQTMVMRRYDKQALN